jgi:hypothetical protein
MNWRAEITKAVTRGVQQACNDIPMFTEDWSGTLAAEYLLTVRVALAISDLNEGIGFPFKVYIEERTRDFIRKCIPVWPVMKDVALRKRIYRAVKRKGKIDIGVTHDSAPSPEPVPVCVIEIKGFDPAVKEIRKDLIRNANFMKIAQLTGKHDMFASFVVLHEGDAGDSTHKDADIKRITKKYRGEVRRIRASRRGLKVDYDVFTAGEEFAQQGPMPEELQSIEGSPHHFVGVIVTFY